MKKLSKGISLLIISVLLSVIGVKEVNAASAYIGVSSSKRQVLVGSSFNVTVKISSSESIGSWQYTLKFDSSQVKLTSGSMAEADAATGSGKTSVSYTYTFKALTSCTANISVKSYAVIGWNEQQMSTSAGSTNVKIITQAQLEASYSTNNYLSNLSVTDYELSPAFNKDTNNYTVTLNADVVSINVVAAVADKTASVTGAGTINVVDGENTINIVVTSQKGTTRTYTIVATVVDLNPIKVTIDKKEYTVVKKVSALTGPSTYVANTTTINDITVPSFYSDITKYTLVGLKNSDNEIGLYIYNAKDNSYIKYNEINFNKIILFPMKLVDVPEKYKEFQIKINDILTTVYKLNKDSNYALIYGVNIETGKANLYMYDSKDNTLQRYNEEELNLYKKDSKEYMIISIIFGTVLLISLVGFICIIRKNNELKNKLLDNKKDKKETKPKEKELKKETEQKNDDFIDK